MRFRAALITMVLASAGAAAALSAHAHGARFSSLKKYDEVPMDVAVETFDDFEERRLRPFWGVEGGVDARVVDDHATDGKGALEVRFPGKGGVLKYRRAGLDAYGGGTSRSIEVLGARFLFNDRFVFDAFNPADTPIRLTVRFTPRAFVYVLAPGLNRVAISTEDIAAAVGRPTQATQSIDFSVEGDAPATLYLDAFRLEREGTGQAMKRFARCFDFGADDMVHPGFIGVDAKSGYDAQRGYGWLQPNSQEEKFKLQTVRSSGAEALDDLLRDGVANLSSPFALDLPAGKYRVHLVAGSNWTGISAAPPVDYDFIIKAEGAVKYARPRAATQEERIHYYYGGDRRGYEFDEDIWRKFAAETYAPIEFEVEVTDGRLDLEFQTSPQVDRGMVNFMVVYPAEQAAAVEPELKRLWYGIMRRFNRVSYRALDAAAAVDLRKPDLYEEFLDPKRRTAKLQAITARPEAARSEVLLFARDAFAQVYPDTVPEPGELTEAFGGAGVPGETVSVAVNAFTLKDVRDLRAEAETFEGPRGRTLSPEAVSVRLVQYSRRMLAPRYVGDWQYQVVPWYLVKPEAASVERLMSVRFWVDVTLPADVVPGRYSGTVNVSTARGFQARARVDIEALPVRLSPGGRAFGVAYYVQPFDPGNEAYGQALRSQVTFGLSRAAARAIETQYTALHRQEISASLGKLRRCGFDTLFVGDWFKDVERANESLAEPMTTVDLNKVNRSAQKRPPSNGKEGGPAFVDVNAGVAYLLTLESLNEKTVAALHDEKLRVVLGYPSVNQAVVDDVGVARMLAGLFLWRSGADGVVAGPARSSWGDPYNPFDGFGGERGSLLAPSSDEWPVPNSSRILEAYKEGISDLRYLVTLEAAVKAAGVTPESAAAGEFLATLRAELPGELSSLVEPTAGSTWRTKPGSLWNAQRYARLRRDVATHLMAIRRAMNIPNAPEGAVQNWP